MFVAMEIGYAIGQKIASRCGHAERLAAHLRHARVNDSTERERVPVPSGAATC